MVGNGPGSGSPSVAGRKTSVAKQMPSRIGTIMSLDKLMPYVDGEVSVAISESVEGENGEFLNDFTPVVDRSQDILHNARAPAYRSTFARPSVADPLPKASRATSRVRL